MSNRLISKTIFVDFLSCPKNVWLKLNKPELFEQFELSDSEKRLLEQGNEVEAHARELFPDGIEVLSMGETACKETKKHMTSLKPAIFQATFIADAFIARNDVLAYDPDNRTWDIYEIKGTNSLKEEGEERSHVDDLAFQTAVLRRAGVPVGHSFLIHLNKEYTRTGNLNTRELFTIEDLTERINENIQQTNTKMDAALAYLTSIEEPKAGCNCNYLGRSRHCTTFKYSHPDVPDYSIHDLTRIGNSKKKLEFLAENEIYNLDEIPLDFELTDNQQNQLDTYRNKRPIINLEKIREELSSLSFPLYFLDYETFAPAIPAFDGYNPYNRIPFQFSLHILPDTSSELKHVEFLHPEKSDPSELVAKLLGEHIGPNGTVVVWHKPMEQGMNKEIAKRQPAYLEILERINGQVYDLKDIFAKQHYVHSDFRGSASIKKVLPVVVPELKYSELPIHEGMQASEQWWSMVSPTTSPEDHARISKELRDYCGLDTYAMYAIWKHLTEISS